MFDRKARAVAGGEKKLTVFISYSHHDMAVADVIVEALERDGFEVLIDRRDLPYGEKWQGELTHFIEQSDTVIWLISSASVTSKWCNWELDSVQKQSKRLVPVRVGDVKLEDLPRQLGEIHILPGQGVFDPATHIESLITTLETDRGWLREHTRLLDRSRQWLLKDRGDGLLLRGRALRDAEYWNSTRPRTAPKPSADVLNFILSSRRASQQRQKRWVGTLVGVLVVTAGFAAVALWQWDRADEAAQRVTRATTLSGWQAFAEPNATCRKMKAYTGEEGLRALYCNLRDVVSYERLEEMAGIPIFLKGPHNNHKLRVQEPTFGYYNPEFIRWATYNLLPGKDDTAYRTVTQPIYDRHMKKMARAYHRTYVQWSRNLDHFEKERRYLIAMIEGTRPWSYMGARWTDKDLRTILNLDVRNENLNPHNVQAALRFWQRRSIDETADDFFAALETMLAIYDPDYLAKAPRPAGTVPHLPPPGHIRDPILNLEKPWLVEPAGPNYHLNDVVVIE